MSSGKGGDKNMSKINNKCRGGDKRNQPSGATHDGTENHEKVLLDQRHLVADGTERDKAAYRSHHPNSKIFEKDDLADVRKMLEDKDETLHELVGSGTFADVYRGVNHQLNKVVAVKIIDLMKASAHYRDQLLPQEIAIIKQLKHPRIVKIFHISQVGFKVVLVMEYAAKGTMSDLIIQIGTLREPVAWTMFREVFDGLAYMHRKSIAHRDLKLENILINHNNLPKRKYLLVFLLTSVLLFYSNTNFQSSGGFFICCLFRWPELVHQQLRFSALLRTWTSLKPAVQSAVDNSLLSDVWSIAVCLYIITNDTFPFRINDDKAMLKAQLNRNWKFRTGTEQTFSEEYRALVRAMLEPDINKRIQTDNVLRHSWMTTVQDVEA